jgi:WD40 repeat protein
VVIGTPDSWDPTTSFSGKDAYEFCTWSPCGRFVAAQTNTTVEIRNQLTFELLAPLQSTKNTPPPTGPLAYSPDGRSLACGFDDAIVIWDIQTGGVVREIECRKGIASLVWSLDGRTIAAALGYGHSIPGVRTFDIVSGAQLFAEQSNWGVAYHLQAHGTSFRTIAMKLCDDDPTLDTIICDIGFPPVKIESFSVMVGAKSLSLPAISFSPSTYRVSISGPGTLRVLDIRRSVCLLEERGDFTSPQFSPDGSLFAASHWHGIRVWKYTSGGYILWGESLFRSLPFSSWDELFIQISPTSPSTILTRCGNVLQLRSLDDPPAISKTSRQYAAISDSGSRILTAYDSECTVAIIDLQSQAPSQFIDTGVEVKGLAVTGNVLLVAGLDKVVAWLLTVEGTVDGVIDNKRVDHSHSIWTIPSPSWRHDLWGCRVEGQVGVIETEVSPFIYHTATGDVLEPAHEPRHFSNPRVLFYKPCDCGEYHHLRNNNLSRYDAPPEDGWKITHATMPKTGWVMDPEGRHRFWVPFDWRGRWGPQNWHHDITTLISNVAGQLVIIKF